MMDLTPAQAAEVLGLKLQTVYFYTSGQTEPSLKMMCEICERLNVSVGYFVGLSEKLNESLRSITPKSD